MMIKKDAISHREEFDNDMSRIKRGYMIQTIIAGVTAVSAIVFGFKWSYESGAAQGAKEATQYGFEQVDIIKEELERQYKEGSR